MFERINKTNPQVANWANRIGRTPTALAMKMCNFGRFDPELSKREISGIAHSGKPDKGIGDEFLQDREVLLFTIRFSRYNPVPAHVP